MDLSDIQHFISERTAGFLKRGTHQLLIDGEWVSAANGATFETRNPATEKVIAKVAAAGAEDIDRAVRAARKAFEEGPWSGMRPVERERLILRLADLVEEHAQALAEIESIDNGKAVAIARAVDLAMTVDFLRYMAGWATKIEGSTQEHSVPYALKAEFVTYTRREAVGVVGAIVPWNFPLMVAVWKLGPALAAGCTVVLKPAEQTPLSALYLGELIREAGFPPGVVNIVTGDGLGAGAPLARHPGVNKISFTGSTEVGKLIGHASVDNMTRFTLELGGKSPVIVLDDCDPEAAAAGAANAIFFNHGQVCCAGSRLYVHKKMYERVVGEIGKIADRMTLGSGFDASAQMGPLVSQEQLDRVCSYIEAGRASGAEIVAGGERQPGAGYFVRPTVLANVSQNARVVQEEIFGPVLTALPYDSIEEVAAWANDSPYGLGASIWSNNLSKVHRLIPKIKAGTVWVNCHSALDPSMPFGGYKQSGIGRDLGRNALDAYLETKSVFIAV
ncbi:phenylacetaldehyde dehydrogenase [Variovorax sp. HW608]|uniref:aldehyde dehydrogenase family protein n=1 Tax=Variovorax sp. HW608 TaxID=1034889 RepID=UPI00081FFFF7|nr:aldehyde dehydrogenase family protein [Variovorax sp. HW608]SCK18780.1 phenylacetaldehyde dehydrogenase [Variovorax sp. HW608]